MYELFNGGITSVDRLLSLNKQYNYDPLNCMGSIVYGGNVFLSMAPHIIIIDKRIHFATVAIHNKFIHRFILHIYIYIYMRRQFNKI